MKFSPEQSDVAAAGQSHAPRADTRDRVLRLHPAVGVVCPNCGSRIGKPCVSTVPFCGVGTIGTPIEGVHVERIAVAHEEGVA